MRLKNSYIYGPKTIMHLKMEFDTGVGPRKRNSAIKSGAIGSAWVLIFEDMTF